MNRLSFIKLLGGSSLSLCVPSFLLGKEIINTPVEEKYFGEKKILLNYNENPYGPFASAKKRISKISDVEYGRYLFDVQQETGIDLSKDLNLKKGKLILSPGSAYLLNVIPHLFRKDYANFVSYDVTYESPVNVARDLGFHTISLDDIQGKQPDFSTIYNVSNSLIYICNPNNPTGTVVSYDTVKKLAEATLKNDNILILDEAYLDYTDHKSAIALIEEQNMDNIIICRTFSKIYGMAGMRLGYFIISENLKKYFGEGLSDQSVTFASCLAASASLSDKAAYEARKSETATLRKLITDFFDTNKIEYYPPSANFVYFIPPSPFEVKEFGELMKKNNIILSRIWGNKKNYIRVSIGKPEEIKYFLDVFKKAIV